MKKLFFISAVLMLLLVFNFTRKAVAQQNIISPPLLRQYPAQVVPPPAPGVQPAGVPPISAPGIPVVQTIPAEKLLANLPQAIVTAQKLNKMITPGKVWVLRAPGGESEIKGGLLYQGVVVAVLRFSPLDGSVLPLGVNPHANRSNVRIQSIESGLSSVIGNLKVLPSAEFMEPEACWLFPVVMDNAIVTHVKIYYDGIHVVQDYAANQEMAFYGK